MGKGGQQPPRIHHGTTKDEQRAALQAFAAMDIDGDGELTAEEIYKALSKHDATITMARVRELVARADVDKNGTVSRDEYLSAVASGENWTKSLRDFIGHDAEHQAKHRVAEKAGFAITEQGLHVGEAFATRLADDVAAAVPRKSGFFRRGTTQPPPPPSKLARFVKRMPVVFWALRVVVPAFGVWLLAHLAHHDLDRAKREWRTKRLRSTTLLFCVAALCDACDCLIHVFVAVAHASDAFDHHAVHVAEERGIRLALVGFACAVVGEIASNNRVGRALSALTHHRKQD